MAVLGTNGKVVFNRSAPAPVVLNIAELNQDKNTALLPGTGFRTGDLVEVASVENWPSANLNTGPLIPTYSAIFDYQDYPELVGYDTAYPSSLSNPYRWLATESGDAIVAENNDVIAVQPSGDGTPYRNRLYVHVDPLNRVSFYRTRGAALKGADDATRENIDQDDFTLEPTGVIELRLVNEWKLETYLQSWSLNLNANEIDITSLGDRFFDGVKSLVQGGGTFDFLVERNERDARNTSIVNRAEYANAYVFYGVDEDLTYNDASIAGSSAGVVAYDNADVTPAPAAFNFDTTALSTTGTSNLLRLLLNTTDQAEAEAEFWLIDSDAQDRTSYTENLQPGDLYYNAQIMVTSSAVSVRATDVITGSANFVTVREVQLREG